MASCVRSLAVVTFLHASAGFAADDPNIRHINKDHPRHYSRRLSEAHTVCTDFPPPEVCVLDGTALYESCQKAEGTGIISLTGTEPWNVGGVYKKCTCAFDAAVGWPHTKCIPILGTAKAPDDFLLAGRETVVNMLKSMNSRHSSWDVLDEMVKYKSRVIAGYLGASHGDPAPSGYETWNDHPEAIDTVDGKTEVIELGGATQEFPSTGYENTAACYKGNSKYTQGRDGLIEEFGHSIQDIAIKHIDQCTYQRLNKAQALACVAGYDKPDSDWDSSTKNGEYYAAGAELVFGDNAIGPQYMPGTTIAQRTAGRAVISRELLHTHDKPLWCLVDLYFPWTWQVNTVQAKCTGANGYPAPISMTPVGQPATWRSEGDTKPTSNPISTWTVPATDCAQILYDLYHNSQQPIASGICRQTWALTVCPTPVNPSSSLALFSGQFFVLACSVMLWL